jgi:hypothetical protein
MEKLKPSEPKIDADARVTVGSQDGHIICSEDNDYNRHTGCWEKCLREGHVEANKIRKVFSAEYTDVPRVFFTSRPMAVKSSASSLIIIIIII